MMRDKRRTQTIRFRNAMTMVIVVATFSPSPHALTNCEQIDDVDARTCCEHSLPSHTMHQVITIVAADEQGTIRELGAVLHWKRFDDGRSRARIAVTDPPRQAGTVVLLTERETHNGERPSEPEVVLYKPGERRDRLITVSALSGEMFGTDLSYDDFAYFLGTNANIDLIRLADTLINERPHIALQAVPKDPNRAYDRGSSYARVVTHLDVEYCTASLTEFFDEDDRLKKRLVTTPDQIKQIAHRWLPLELTMYDLSRTSHTVIKTQKVEIDGDLRDSLFSRVTLKRGR